MHDEHNDHIVALERRDCVNRAVYANMKKGQAEEGREEHSAQER